ncbi:MAG: hypothetical protein AAF658_03575, partial [Myxococcota bacterium]
MTDAVKPSDTAGRIPPELQTPPPEGGEVKTAGTAQVSQKRGADRLSMELPPGDSGSHLGPVRTDPTDGRLAGSTVALGGFMLTPDEHAAKQAAPGIEQIREHLDNPQELALRSVGAEPEGAAKLYQDARDRQIAALSAIKEDDAEAKVKIRDAVADALKAFEKYGADTSAGRHWWGGRKQPNYQKASDGLEHVLKTVSGAFTQQQTNWHVLKERVGQTYTIIQELHEERHKAAADRDNVNGRILSLAAQRDELEQWLGEQPSEVTENLADAQTQRARIVSQLSELTRYQRMLSFHIDQLGLEIEK